MRGEHGDRKVLRAERRVRVVQRRRIAREQQQALSGRDARVRVGRLAAQRGKPRADQAIPEQARGRDRVEEGPSGAASSYQNRAVTSGSTARTVSAAETVAR